MYTREPMVMAPSANSDPTSCRVALVVQSSTTGVVIAVTIVVVDVSFAYRLGINVVRVPFAAVAAWLLLKRISIFDANAMPTNERKSASTWKRPNCSPRKMRAKMKTKTGIDSMIIVVSAREMYVTAE